MKNTCVPVTPAFRKKLTKIIKAGLTSGLGNPKPGEMCIEAAICFARGYKHGDAPVCVAEPDRRYAIRINDSNAWPSKAVRAEFMLPLAFAQLNTAGTDRKPWVKRLVEGTIRRVLPIYLRNAASSNPKHAADLDAAAARCEAEGTREAAQNAREVAHKAWSAAYDAAAYAAAYAAAAYDAAAADAAAAYAYDAAYDAADAAAAAAYAYDAAYDAANAYDAATYAAAAADAATYAAAAADAAAYAYDAATYAAAAADAAAYARKACRLRAIKESIQVALDAYKAEGRS